MPDPSGYDCPLCPRSFHDDAGVRVHLTETHQLYDVVRAAPVPAATVIDLTDAKRPTRRNPLAHVTFEREPDIWTLFNTDGGEDTDPARSGGRAGAYIAILAGLILVLVAFLPH